MTEIKKCDMCGKKIENGKCECGQWYIDGELKNHPIPLAIENFHDMKEFILTCDCPPLGCAAIFFRGDYNDCQNVAKFICEIKGWPFYEKGI